MTDKLVMLVKRDDTRLEHNKKLAEDMLLILSQWAKQKFNYDLNIGSSHVHIHQDPRGVSYSSLRTLIDVIYPDADKLVIMGPWTIGSWMGLYDYDKICYGYYQARSWKFWQNLRKVVPWSITHELSHRILHEQGKSRDLYVDRVHENDSESRKDFWKFNLGILTSHPTSSGAQYVTLGGEYA